MDNQAADLMSPLPKAEHAQLEAPSRLTSIHWLICAVACLAFTFGLYEGLMLPLIVRPMLADLGNLGPGSRGFNL